MRRNQGRNSRAKKLGYCLALGLLWMAMAGARGQQTQADVVPIVHALQTGDSAEALRLCRAALAKTPGDYRVWTLQGMATAQMGKPAEALGLYQHALRLAPEYLPALEGAAQTEFQLGQPGARKLLEKILAQRPGDPVTHVLMGILDAREKKCASAVEHFKKAGPVLARQPEAQTDNGICLVEMHRDNEAVEAFAAVVAAAPADAAARYNLALAQWDMHRADDALKALEPLIEGAAPNPDALVLAAEIAESKDDTERAVTLLRQALVIDPKFMDAYLGFATLSYDHASPQVGVDMLDFGLKQLPKEPRLYLVRGVLLAQMGEFARAADDFAEASQLDPHMQFLGVATGLVQSQMQHSAEALGEFRAAVKAHPAEAMAHYLLAEALNGAGEQPGSAAYSEELEAAKTAVRLDAKFLGARDLLASIYLENGQAEESIAQSKAALALDPDDQQAVYHLIVALRKMGDKEQIPGLLKRLTELRADPKVKQEHTKHYRLYVEHQQTP